MEYKDIVNLIRLVNKSNLSEFKMRDGEFEISIRTDKYSKASKDGSGGAPAIVQVPQTTVPPQIAPQAQQTAQVEESMPAAPKTQAENSDKQSSEGNESGLVAVKSPIVGTFYRSPSPDKAPYVKVGDRIEVGSVVCIVEAMKLFNEIESEVSGKIVKVMIEDASPVEYDQVLFMVDPNA
jgi:acetyl-CoA carboxylase biotin carboxyl carrier protein